MLRVEGRAYRRAVHTGGMPSNQHDSFTVGKTFRSPSPCRLGITKIWAR